MKNRGKAFQRWGCALIALGLLPGFAITAFSMMRTFNRIGTYGIEEDEALADSERMTSSIDISFTLGAYLMPLAGIGLLLAIIGTYQRFALRTSAPSFEAPTGSASEEDSAP